MRWGAGGHSSSRAWFGKVGTGFPIKPYSIKKRERVRDPNQAERALANPIFFSAKPDLVRAVDAWRTWLTAERRASRHTADAYSRDLSTFLTFLTAHHGAEPDLGTLRELRTADVRSYLAHRSTDGLARTSMARGLS